MNITKIALAAAVFAFGLLSPACGVTIETVPVGDVGNPNDLATGVGAVSYAYSIGKYEVTFAQYAESLNAVAATDAKGLWGMTLGQSTTTPKILRSGTSGSYAYTVVGAPNKPVGRLNYESVARFANWMHNGQPRTGVEDATTTEDGAYTIPANNRDFQLFGINRNPGAKWFIPSDSEWYKAAYYQPASKGGDRDGYWLFPMRTNSFPYSAMPPGSAAPDTSKSGNFNYNDTLANGYSDGFAVTGASTLVSGVDYLTDVGAYSSSSSYYGTFDQGGNAFEFTEGVYVTSFGSFRTERGGDAFQGGGVTYLQATVRADFRSIGGFTGIRLATLETVPEPAALVLLASGLAVFLARRRSQIGRG